MDETWLGGGLALCNHLFVIDGTLGVESGDAVDFEVAVGVGFFVDFLFFDILRF